MDNNILRLTFGGDVHYMDTNTLIAELTHVVAVINIANEELGNGSRKVKINVNAIEKGSFVIELGVVESLLQSLFSSKRVEYAAAVTTVATAVYKIYKKFKGRRLTKEDEEEAKTVLNSPSIITGKNSEVKINNIINVYNRQQTREAISSAVRAAEDDGNIENINIESKNVEVIIEKDEFGELANDTLEEDLLNHEPVFENVEAILTIKQLNFEKGNLWKFYWQGIEIKMKVRDGVLFEQIDKGERFGKGDKIKVRLKIHKIWNETYSCYENKNYSIEEFYEIIKPNEQQKIEL